MGLLLGPEVRLKMWIRENYQYLESWCPLKRKFGTLASTGDTEQFATKPSLTPPYRQCSVSPCSDTSAITKITNTKSLNTDPNLSSPSSPVRFTGHEEHQALPYLKNEEPNATDECVVTICTSDRISREPTTAKSCKNISIFDLDPLFVLLVLAYNTAQYVDRSVLPSSLDIIGFQSSWFVFPPHWLSAILGGNKGCRRRRWIAACSILWVDDYVWRTLSSAALWTFALPQLDSARLQKLLTAANLAEDSCGRKSTWVPYQFPQQTTLPIHPGGSAFRGGGRPPQPGQSGTGNSQSGGSRRRPSGGGGPRGSGPGGRGGGGAAGGGHHDLDSNNQPNRPESPGWACPYFKRWPLEHLACLHQPQKAPRYVKTHLLRKHKQPVHCAICHDIFESHTDLDLHIMARSCSQASGPSPYRHAISHDQRDALKNLQHNGGDEAEKWYQMWDILFPGVQRPDSPYMTGGNSEQLLQIVHDVIVPQYEYSLNHSRLLSSDQSQYAVGLLRDILLRRPVTPTRYLAPDAPLLQLPGSHQQHYSEPNHLQRQQGYRPQNEASRSGSGAASSIIPPLRQPGTGSQPLRRSDSRRTPRNTPNADQRGHISPGIQSRSGLHPHLPGNNTPRRSVTERRDIISRHQMSRTPSLNPTMQQQQPLPSHGLPANPGTNQVMLYPGVVIPPQDFTQAPGPRAALPRRQDQYIPANYPPQNHGSGRMPDYTETVFQYPNNSGNNFTAGGCLPNTANPLQLADTNPQMFMGGGGYGSLSSTSLHNSLSNQGQRMHAHAPVSMRNPEQLVAQLRPTHQMASSQEEVPGTSPGQTVMPGNGLDYLNSEDLGRLHNNDVSSHLVPAQDDPEALELSDSSQVGSPSDLLP